MKWILMLLWPGARFRAGFPPFVLAPLRMNAHPALLVAMKHGTANDMPRAQMDLPRARASPHIGQIVGRDAAAGMMEMRPAAR
jgi:hypothetical protein